VSVVPDPRRVVVGRLSMWERRADRSRRRVFDEAYAAQALTEGLYGDGEEVAGVRCARRAVRWPCFISLRVKGRDRRSPLAQRASPCGRRRRSPAPTAFLAQTREFVS